jgi:hypothetical protein
MGLGVMEFERFQTRMGLGAMEFGRFQTRMSLGWFLGKE